VAERVLFKTTSLVERYEVGLFQQKVTFQVLREPEILLALERQLQPGQGDVRRPRIQDTLDQLAEVELLVPVDVAHGLRGVRP